MAPDITDPMPIESRDELVAWLESGCKPEADFRIGTEHEKFGFFEDTLAPVPYEGERSIRRILENMQHLLGWEPVADADLLIGLKDPTAGGAISLEPGGQFELSGAPLENIHQTCREVHSHLAQLREVAEPLGIGFLGLGFAPSWTRAEIPTMPKQRYKIMTAYMPKVGSLGIDMMYRTCTVQVNLDFSSETDMVRKMRIGLALQPIATALFANSPFKEAKPNGFLSLRSEIWRDTDNDRAGMLPFVFEDGFSFERWVDYALDVPMYFVKRGETYYDVAGQSFRDFMAGRLPGFPGERATRSDWADHLTTIFPEVRLKRYIEMRGADGGPWRELCALPAFWVGLLYDRASLDAAWDLVKDWTAEERQALRDAVPRTALKTPFRKHTVREVAREAVAIARGGLARRARSYGGEDDETRFIDKLAETAETGITPAEVLLDEYENEWGGDISEVFRRHAY